MKFGPVDVETLRRHASLGKVKAGDAVIGPGLQYWTRLSEAMSIINSSAGASSSQDEASSEEWTEGDYASVIGNSVIWFSLISAAVCVFAFGRVEMPGRYGITTENHWNIILVSIYMGAGLNGAFFGYLLAKVGSILKRLEVAVA